MSRKGIWLPARVLLDLTLFGIKLKPEIQRLKPLKIFNKSKYRALGTVAKKIT